MTRAWASGEYRGIVGGELLEATGRLAKDRRHIVSDVIGVASANRESALALSSATLSADTT